MSARRGLLACSSRWPRRCSRMRIDVGRRAAQLAGRAADHDAGAGLSKPDPNPKCTDPTASLQAARRPAGARPDAGGQHHGGDRAQGRARRRRRSEHAAAGLRNPCNGRPRGLRDRHAARALTGDLRPARTRSTSRRSPRRSGSPRCATGRSTSSPTPCPITCWRRTLVDFSSVYYDAAQRVLVPNDLARALDLGTYAASASARRAGRPRSPGSRKLRPRVIPYAVAQRTDCLVALQEGEVDAISSDDAILLGFQAQDPYTKLDRPRPSPTSRTRWRSASAIPTSCASSTACWPGCAPTAAGRRLYRR